MALSEGIASATTLARGFFQLATSDA